MAESQAHIDLTIILHQYINQILKIDAGYILIDSPESCIGNKPPIIEDFRPDIYAKTKDILVIGDAKTYGDWDKKHSRNQYLAYITECINFKYQSILLLAVPWRLERSVRSRLKHMFPFENHPNIELIVISELWGM